MKRDLTNLVIMYFINDDAMGTKNFESDPEGRVNSR